ncbi:MAG: hypothetical protein B6D55_04920 [Candidatus Omnitrophica bacterium 4484_70.2]|nr:MAG: hypothetical protein B6D55_04920 [Candidatus Omnitrophica bacterium 4484_70.2]
MKANNTKFICEIQGNFLKIARFDLNEKKKTIKNILWEVIDIQDKEEIKKKVKLLLEKFHFRNTPIIVSLPRNLVTYRILRIPSQNEEEIEKIVSLQAPQLLPYSSEELITAYSIIRRDKEGYSFVSLIVVRKDIIENLMHIFSEEKKYLEKIILSSYGVYNAYRLMRPKEKEVVLVVNIDSPFSEIIIGKEKHLLFSRAFKFSQSDFISEIEKTVRVYEKENIEGKPQKFILSGRISELRELKLELERKLEIQGEVISLEEEFKISDLIKNVSSTSFSLTTFLGLLLGKIDENLNLIPSSLKKEREKIYLKKEFFKIINLLIGTLFFLSLPTIKDFYNKIRYLKKLKSQLSEVSSYVEKLKKKKEFLEIVKKNQNNLKIIDFFYKMSDIIPQNLFLTEFSYDKERLLLRGEAKNSSSIFRFSSSLKKLPFLKKVKVFYVKERRANERKIMQFKIECILKK